VLLRGRDGGRSPYTGFNTVTQKRVDLSHTIRLLFQGLAHSVKKALIPLDTIVFWIYFLSFFLGWRIPDLITGLTPVEGLFFEAGKTRENPSRSLQRKKILRFME